MTDADPAEQVWRTAVAKVLKGAAPETLVSRTSDGLPVEPLYPAADTAGSGPWRDISRPFGILQRVDHPDPGAAHALARTDLDNGATGLVLVGAGSPAAHGFGIAPADLPALLDGLPIGGRSLRLDVAPADAPAAMDVVAAAAARDGYAPDGLDVDLGLDPLAPPAEVLASVRALRDRGIIGPVLRADGRPQHAAGASEAQELAAVLAAGVAALRALEPLGLDAARSAVSFALAADANQLLTIAKFRAFRRLWSQVEAACGLTPRPARLHAETAWRMLARQDPHTNILRTAIAVAAAILGGADGVTVLPFTTPLGLPDTFARRLARNTPLVLLEEAHLGRVADPAAGSGAIEAITDGLAAKAWGLFQSLERQGDLAAAFQSGGWGGQLAVAREMRRLAIADGVATLVGVTRFQNPSEMLPPVLLPTPSDPIAETPGHPYSAPDVACV